MKSVAVLAFLCAVPLCACASGHAPSAPASASPAPTRAAAVASTARPVETARATQTAAPVGPVVTASAATPTPLAAPPAQPSDQPSSEAVAVAAPTATPTATPIVLPSGVPWADSDAPPQIITFELSTTLVHPGDVLSGRVTASSNVASVEVRVAGYSYVMSKTAPGEFVLSVKIPSVPKIFRRTYPLVAIARNTRGDATQRETQLTIR
jgi:hypothetical protein